MKLSNLKNHKTFLIILIIIALATGIGYKVYFTTECPNEFRVDDSPTFGGGSSYSYWLKDGKKMDLNVHQSRWILKNCKSEN
ncbi:hypothetical protein IPJ72_00415 [Candidatus Peregrinibacteria bacterium]|nr:MAG: hypothetical protein IPJ72_00415 [Candidatus Peregrinibacteria bacterium]